MFLTIATSLHCLQSQLEEMGISDLQMFRGWFGSWICSNLLFLAHAIKVQGREVNLVRQLGLTRTADAGSGLQIKIDQSTAGNDDFINQGMGGITDVRVMLREQKRLSKKKALRRAEEKLHQAEIKVSATTTWRQQQQQQRQQQRRQRKAKAREGEAGISPATVEEGDGPEGERESTQGLGAGTRSDL